MHAPLADQPWLQLFWLFVLAIPIACVAWTVTHEEVFREPREYCQEQSQKARTVVRRKFFYLFTCEYCFSHYVTIFFLFLTRYRLLLDDFRGYLLSFFGLVWVANIYMSLFGRLRVDIRSERAEATTKEKEAVVKEKEAQIIEHKLEVTKRRRGSDEGEGGGSRGQEFKGSRDPMNEPSPRPSPGVPGEGGREG